MRRHLIGPALAIAFLVATPAVAHAGGPGISVNTGSGWTHDPSSPLFDASRIAPGWAEGHDVDVRNDADTSAALKLSALDIVEDENGCDHPEGFVDTTCETSGGELGHELVLTVSSGSSATPLWTGSLYDLQQPLTLSADMAGGATDTYRIDASLPYSSGNETQTDQVSFALKLTLDGADAVVQGVKVTRPPHSVLGSVVTALPFTGSYVEGLLTGGLWLLLAGIAMLHLGRRLRPRVPRR